MLIAGSVDLNDALRDLASVRTVFHSEADLQHALAWQVHLADPLIQVRLETRAAEGERLDLWFWRPDLRLSSALELKYLCAGLDVTVNDERFRLPNQGAEDIRGYDVIKDIVRIEGLLASDAADTGAVVALTNDQMYWHRPDHGRSTGAAAFRLYEGETLEGTRTWGAQSAGTQKHRDHDLVLRGHYNLHWQDYSQVNAGRAGMFRILVIEVEGC